MGEPVQMPIHKAKSGAIQQLAKRIDTGASTMVNGAITDMERTVASSEEYNAAHKTFKEDAEAEFNKAYDKSYKEYLEGYRSGDQELDAALLADEMAIAMVGGDLLRLGIVSDPEELGKLVLDESVDGLYPKIRQAYGEDKEGAERLITKIGKEVKLNLKDIGKMSEKEQMVAESWWYAKGEARDAAREWVNEKAPDLFKGTSVSLGGWRWGEWKKGTFPKLVLGGKSEANELAGEVTAGLRGELGAIMINNITKLNADALDTGGGFATADREAAVPLTAGDPLSTRIIGTNLVGKLNSQAKKLNVPIEFKLIEEAGRFRINYTITYSGTMVSAFTGKGVKGTKRA